MNIKKCSLKTMCAALACTTVLSSMLAAYATNTTVYETPMDDSVGTESIETLANDSAGTAPSDSGWTTEENSFEDIKVTYQQSSSYTVTIPKTITLGTNKQAVYSVKVAGNIDANQRVYVAPVDGITDTSSIDFYMSDLSGKKENVVATVTHNKTYWNSENVANAYEETNNSVSAPNLTAGTWEGTFQVEIRLETEKEQEHVHNYIDGKCECGAVDPNHTHIYEDGSCTICGEKEADPYETAPAEAYSNWNYTLDDENDIITLNYYKGSEAAVIVYANYMIGEKSYKTQIADAVSFGRTYMFANKENIKTVKFSDSLDTSAVTNMEGMFYYCKALTSIDFGENFNTSSVTDMSGMFEQCELLTNLDVSRFDTSSVTDMTQMFANCKSLERLDVSNFDTGNVSNMSSMFSGCSTLTGLDLGGFNTRNVTNMNNMFNKCSALEELNLNSFDTANVTNMYYMFIGCSALAELNLGSFDTSNVVSMASMFEQCTSLADLDLSSFDTRNVTNMSSMFRTASNLKTIYATSGKWSTAKAGSTATYMFYNCGTSSVTYK